MGVSVLPIFDITVDPFSIPQTNVDRYTMHYKLDGFHAVQELGDDYYVMDYNENTQSAFAAALFQGFVFTPEREVYPRLTTSRGCREMVKEWASLPGFLPQVSKVVYYKDAPVAAILVSREYGCVFGNIHLVAVAPRHRGKGIGTYLLKTVLNEFITLGLKHVTTQLIRENRRSLVFFRKKGFQTKNADRLF